MYKIIIDDNEFDRDNSFDNVINWNDWESELEEWNKEWDEIPEEENKLFK